MQAPGEKQGRALPAASGAQAEPPGKGPGCPELFGTLVHLLEQELAVMRDLCAVTARQVDALRRAITEQILVNAHHQEAMAHQLALLERERLKWQQELERVLGLPAGAALSQVIPLASPAVREKLAGLRSGLLETVEELGRLNDTCRRLAARGLGVTRQSLRLLSSISGQAYGPEGVLKNLMPEGVSRLDRSC